MNLRSKKDYPEWTVPKCICYVGHFRSDCPYALEEQINEFFAQKEGDNEIDINLIK